MKNKNIFILIMISIALLFLVGATTFPTLTMYEWYQGPSNDDATISETDQVMQVFRIGTTGTNITIAVHGISIEGREQFPDNPPENVTFSIFAINASGPTGPALVLVTVLSDAWADTTEWQNLTVNQSGTLTKGQAYALIANSSATASTGEFRWGHDSTTPTYTGGCRWYAISCTDLVNGCVWGEQCEADVMFEIYGNITSEVGQIDMDVELIFPDDGITFSTTGSNFTGNYTPTNANLTNATYTLWYPNSSIFNETTVTVLGSAENTTTYFIDQFNIGNYIWNIWACGINSTGTHCEWAASNRTFSVGASLNTESFNNNTYETKNERFEANISLITGSTLRFAELFYNFTAYSGTVLNTAVANYSLSTSLDVPPITLSSDNFTFFWRLTFEKADGSFVFQNMTSNTQQVTEINFAHCGGSITTIAMNFTVFDEGLVTQLGGFDFGATFNYWLGTGATTKNISFNNDSIKEMDICIYPSNLTYYLINSDIEYEADVSGYGKRNYYFNNYTINSVTDHIQLFLLNSTDSTSFILHVQTPGKKDVEGALVYSQRYYPDLGLYKTVQIAKTGSDGKSIGFFKTETVEYRFLITLDGITRLLTSKQKIFPESAPYTLTFVIGEALETPWGEFEDLLDLTTTLIFNDTTNITTYTYVDTSGIFTQGRLIVEEIRFNETDIVICNTTSTETSATLTCNLNGRSGTFVARGFITRNSGEKMVELIYITITTVIEIMGRTGLLLAFFIILTATMAFIWHPIAGIWGMVSSVILVNLVGLVSWSYLFIFGVIAMAIILTFVIKD